MCLTGGCSEAPETTDGLCMLCNAGLTPAEPEVLPWDDAEALWIEWGGVG